MRRREIVDPQIFLDVSFPESEKQNISLNELINFYCFNTYTDHCNYCQEHSQQSFDLDLYLSEYLIIRIKYENELVKSNKNKNEKILEFETNNFNLSLFSSWYEKIEYDLISVIYHSGSFENAHYVNYSIELGEWYKFDDNKKTKEFPQPGRLCFLVYKRTNCKYYFFIFKFIKIYFK